MTRTVSRTTTPLCRHVRRNLRFQITDRIAGTGDLHIHITCTTCWREWEGYVNETSKSTWRSR